MIDERMKDCFQAIVPHTPSEKYMRATLGLIFFFYMEEKDGTRAKHDIYTYGRPTKL